MAEHLLSIHEALGLMSERERRKTSLRRCHLSKKENVGKRNHENIQVELSAEATRSVRAQARVWSASDMFREQVALSGRGRKDVHRVGINMSHLKGHGAGFSGSKSSPQRPSSKCGSMLQI